MAFRNSILAGEELVRSAIRSENYVPGVSGWRIARDGSAEFSDAVIRGELIVGVAPGPRIEVLPDWDGGGNPGILMYPGGGADPIVLETDGADGLWIRTEDGITSLHLTAAGIDLATQLAGVGVLGLATSAFVFTGPGAAPPATLEGEAFDLFARHDRETVTPGGNLDVTAAAFAAWSPTINVTVPLWATRVQVAWWATAIDPTGLGTWRIRSVLDGVGGIIVSTTPSSMLTYSEFDEFTGLTPGDTIVLEVQGERTAGAAALRANTASRFTYALTWLA